MTTTEAFTVEYAECCRETVGRQSESLNLEQSAGHLGEEIQKPGPFSRYREETEPRNEGIKI